MDAYSVSTPCISNNNSESSNCQLYERIQEQQKDSNNKKHSDTTNAIKDKEKEGHEISTHVQKNHITKR